MLAFYLNFLKEIILILKFITNEKYYLYIIFHLYFFIKYVSSVIPTFNIVIEGIMPHGNKTHVVRTNIHAAILLVFKT